MNAPLTEASPPDDESCSESHLIAQLRRERDQARSELEDFTYSVSHDLRASLRHVNAYVQIIKEDLGHQTSGAVASHLERVSHAARQMGLQIDALTELSRLTRLDLDLTTVAVAPLVQDVCRALAPILAGRRVEWQVADNFPALRCDATLLRQVLMHVLSNALKFTAPRTIATIEITWQIHDSGLCALTVTDNGVGFNPDYTPKLFHAFQRLHGSREFEGLGMGLALTRKIVARHGGMVWAIGAPDSGCRVSFTLPLAPVA